MYSNLFSCMLFMKGNSYKNLNVLDFRIKCYVKLFQSVCRRHFAVQYRINIFVNISNLKYCSGIIQRGPKNVSLFKGP